MKLSFNEKTAKSAAKKYTRIVLTEKPKTFHRLVQTVAGTTEYHMGVGKFKDIKARTFITLIRSVVQAAKKHQIEHLVIDYDALAFPALKDLPAGWRASTIAENLLLSDYTFTKYKTGKGNKTELKEVLICGRLTAADKKGFKRGQTVGTYVNQARDIANTTGDDLTPSVLAKTAQTLAKGTKVKVTVLNHTQIKKAGLHALWAVGKGADDMPRLIVMEYYGAGKPVKNSKDKKKKPLVMVGKGITYDTGGLNVKPSGAMHDMHMDMSGGSSVIASIVCAAKLGLKKNIVAIIPAAENAVSDRAMRAGDIIQSHAGKTIEVMHTDAEGRLVLADGLSYSKKFHPRAVIDVATLTGAALAALGQHASALMTKNDTFSAKLRACGEESGDYVWPLPLWDEYKQHIKSDRADIANIAPNFSRFGGSIEGGTFLSFFAPKCPWAHLDIAPRMESISSDKLAKGSTGEPVRLLVKFLEQY